MRSPRIGPACAQPSPTHCPNAAQFGFRIRLRRLRLLHPWGWPQATPTRAPNRSPKLPSPWPKLPADRKRRTILGLPLQHDNTVDKRLDLELSKQVLETMLVFRVGFAARRACPGSKIIRRDEPDREHRHVKFGMRFPAIPVLVGFFPTVPVASMYSSPPGAKCFGASAITGFTIASPSLPPSWNTHFGRNTGTYGGCTMIRSKRIPSPGAYRSPSLIVAFCTSFNLRLNSAKAVLRGEMSKAYEWPA